MAESQNVEYKASWQTEYLKWVCGFANAQGGTIYIGIDDAGNVVGVKDVKKLMDYIEIKVNSSTYSVNYHGDTTFRAIAQSSSFKKLPWRISSEKGQIISGDAAS